MNDSQEPTSLEDLLKRLSRAGEGRDEDGKVSFETMLQAVGPRSFGPLLLLAGLIAFSPLSGIPGMPTTIGVMVLVLAGQLLIGRHSFWMPRWMLRRSVSRQKIEKALRFLTPVARFIDKLIRPRLTVLTRKPALYIISFLALLVGLAAPVLELLPFVISIAGAALMAFGLALLAHDGVLLLIALTFYLAAAGFILAKLLL